MPENHLKPSGEKFHDHCKKIQYKGNVITDITDRVLAFSLLIMLCWMFGVTKDWVRDAVDAYASALLVACEGKEP